MGHILYLSLRGLLGTESSYRSRSKEGWQGGSWGESASSYMNMREVSIVSSCNTGLIPSNRDVRAASIGSRRPLPLGVEKLLPLAKMIHQNLGLSVPYFIKVFSHLKIFKILFLTNQCPNFSCRHLTRLAV